MTIRTAVYIDGYNFYYGRLRGTNYKWLDLCKLFSNILKKRGQNEELVCLHLFTAPAIANFATHKEASTQAQTTYIRAHEHLYPDVFKVTYGKHSYDRGGSLVPAFIEGQPYDRTIRHRVWQIEEKKTDVNLAITMYRDAILANFDRIILVSNDSDAEPALAAIKQDCPNLMVGLITPSRPRKEGEKVVSRAISASLTRQVSWSLASITDEQLEAAQFPHKIPTRKKPLIKPEHW